MAIVHASRSVSVFVQGSFVKSVSATGVDSELTPGSQAMGHEEHYLDCIIPRGAAVRLKHDAVAARRFDTPESI